MNDKFNYYWGSIRIADLVDNVADRDRWELIENLLLKMCMLSSAISLMDKIKKTSSDPTSSDIATCQQCLRELRDMFAKDLTHFVEE